MYSNERSFLLHSLDITRISIEDLLPMIDPRLEIYPGWTIKELLAHMTGWDDATIDAIRAHISNLPLTLAAIHSLDEYNEMTVTSRKDLDYDHILKEWELTRQVLRTLIEQMPEEKFLEPVVVPWGEKRTIPFLINLFRNHEEEHAKDIRNWLGHQKSSLTKEDS